MSVILFVRRLRPGNGGGIGFPSRVIEGFPYAPGRQKHGGSDLLLGAFSFGGLSLLACVLPTGKCCLYEHASITCVHKPCRVLGYIGGGSCPLGVVPNGAGRAHQKSRYSCPPVGHKYVHVTPQGSGPSIVRQNLLASTIYTCMIRACGNTSIHRAKCQYTR